MTITTTVTFPQMTMAQSQLVGRYLRYALRSLERMCPEHMEARACKIVESGWPKGERIDSVYERVALAIYSAEKIATCEIELDNIRYVSNAQDILKGKIIDIGHESLRMMQYLAVLEGMLLAANAEKAIADTTY